MLKIFLILLTVVLNGCAYRFGLSERALPGGYTQVAIPMFKNKTTEVGIEPYFTNAIIRRFNRSQVAKVTDKDASPVTLEGTILTITSNQNALVSSAPQVNGQPTTASTTLGNALPTNSVLTTEYRIVVTAKITLKRKSDDRVIWQGNFQTEKIYDPPRIGTAIVNSADSTYNHSVRMETLSLIAETMMAEAHDRITENY